MKFICDDTYTRNFFEEIEKQVNKFQRKGEEQPELIIRPLYEWLYQKNKRLISTPEYNQNEVIIKFGKTQSLILRYNWIDKYTALNEGCHEILWDDTFPENIQNVLDYLLDRKHLPIAESYIHFLWKVNKKLGKVNENIINENACQMQVYKVLDNSGDNGWNLILKQAAKEGDFELMKWVIQHKNANDFIGAAKYAALGGKLNTLEVCLDNIDDDDYTWLMYWIGRGQSKECLDFVIDMGINIDWKAIKVGIGCSDIENNNFTDYLNLLTNKK